MKQYKIIESSWSLEGAINGLAKKGYEFVSAFNYIDPVSLRESTKVIMAKEVHEVDLTSIFEGGQ